MRLKVARIEADGPGEASGAFLQFGVSPADVRQVVDAEVEIRPAELESDLIVPGKPAIGLFEEANPFRRVLGRVFRLVEKPRIPVQAHVDGAGENQEGEDERFFHG